MSKSTRSEVAFGIGEQLGHLIVQTPPGQQVVTVAANALAQTGASAVAAGTALVAAAGPVAVVGFLILGVMALLDDT